MIEEKTGGNSNIIHYVSIKSKTVCWSVLGAKLLAMIEGFNIGDAIRYVISEMTGEDIPFALYTDSQSFYHFAVSLTRTRERRMQLDLQILREAHERRDITNKYWISGKPNPVDGLIKKMSNSAMP